MSINRPVEVQSYVKKSKLLNQNENVKKFYLEPEIV